MNGGGAIPAIAIAAKRRRILEAFRRAGAVSLETAKTLDDVGVSDSTMLRRLQSSGVIVPLGDGLRFYLDVEAERAIVGRKPLVVLAIFAVFLAFMVYVLLTKR